jgi:hypothetical protein
MSSEQKYVRLTLPGAPDIVDIPGLHIGPLRPGIPVAVPDDRVQAAIHGGAPLEWADDSSEPITGYQDATVDDIVGRLDSLSVDELNAVHAFESNGKQRRGVLDAVAKAIQTKSQHTQA